MATSMTEMKHPKVVSHERMACGAQGDFWRRRRSSPGMRDELSRQRRELPWEKVEKEYVFEGPRRQGDTCRPVRRTQPARHLPLHAGPWMGRGLQELLVSADHFDGMAIHLAQSRRDTGGGFARAVSRRSKRSKSAWAGDSIGSRRSAAISITTITCRSPRQKSAGQADYNYDRYAVSQRGAARASVFSKDADGQIFHTYSTYARGTRHPGRHV